MKRVISVLLCHAVAALAFAELIPAARLATWTPGTTVGVDGGIEQYLDGSGHANERSTASLRNVVVSDSADNTGATDARSAIATGFAASSTGIYLPAGVYNISAPIQTAYADNKTIRGAGTWTLSTSSNTIAGSGTKTFTVETGLPHTSGIGVIARKRNDPETWMRGTVSSYSGTTLSMSVSSSSGSGTYSDWQISITYLDAQGGQGAFEIGGTDGYVYFSGNFGMLPESGYSSVTVTGEADKGDTVLTFADAGTISGFSVGDLFALAIEGDTSQATMNAGGATVMSFGLRNPEYRNEYLRRIVGKVAGKSSNQITVDAPLPFAIPAAKIPRFYSTSQYSSKVGVENLAIGCSGATVAVLFSQAMNCWLYNVHADYSTNYSVKFEGCYKCQVQKVSAIGQRVVAPNHGGILYNYSCNGLIQDNAILGSFPAFEVNAGATNNVFFANFCQDDGFGIYGYINANHGPHNSFNLYEHNISSYWKGDGYFGTQSEETLNRNWWVGEGITIGLIAALRGTYVCNFVGNVMGWDGNYDGAFSYGNPNLGNSGNSGFTHQPFIDSSTWAHFDGSGTLIGTVTDRSNRIVTLDSLSAATYLTPDYVSGSGHDHISPSSYPNTHNLYWLTWQAATMNYNILPTTISGFTITYPGAHADFTVSSITRSGSTATLTTSGDHGLLTTDSIWVSGADQSEYNGAFAIATVPTSTTITFTVSGSPASPATGTIIANDFPPNGAVVVVDPGNPGFQELDLQTQATAIQKGNYLVTGASGTQESTGGDTIPDSFAYSAKPSWWRDRAWPAIDPASPTFSYDIIPAGYRFVNGADAPEGGGGGGGSATPSYQRGHRVRRR